MASEASEAGEGDEPSALGLFQEPEGFYEAEKEPTFAEHVLLSGQTLRVRLVGFNPLWVSNIVVLSSNTLFAYRHCGETARIGSAFTSHFSTQASMCHVLAVPIDATATLNHAYS